MRKNLPFVLPTISFVTLSLPALEWTLPKTGRPPEDHSTPSQQQPPPCYRGNPGPRPPRRRRTRGMSGAFSSRRRFPTRSLGHKHNRFGLRRCWIFNVFFIHTFAFLSNKVFTRCFFVVGGKTNWSERFHVNARIGNLFSKHLLAIFLTSQNQYMNRMLRKKKWIKWGISGCCRPILSLPNHLIRAKLNYWMVYMSVYLPGRQGRRSAL